MIYYPISHISSQKTCKHGFSEVSLHVILWSVKCAVFVLWNTTAMSMEFMTRNYQNSINNNILSVHWSVTIRKLTTRKLNRFNRLFSKTSAKYPNKSILKAFMAIKALRAFWQIQQLFPFWYICDKVKLYGTETKHRRIKSLLRILIEK